MRLPLGVVVVAILFIIGGIISTLWGIIQAGTGGVGWLTGLLIFSEDVRVWGGSAILSGLLGFVLGIAQVIVAFGLLLRQSWAWLVALILSALWLFNALVATFSGYPFAILGTIVPGFCLIVLLSTAARAAFHQVPS